MEHAIASDWSDTPGLAEVPAWVGLTPFLDGTNADVSEYVVVLGRLLRSKPPQDIHEHAVAALVRHLTDKEVFGSIKAVTVYHGEAACGAKRFLEYNLPANREQALRLLASRDDLESMRLAVRSAALHGLDLLHDDGFVDLCLHVEVTIEQVDLLVEMYELLPCIVQSLLQPRPDSVSEYSHLSPLTECEHDSWWLAVLWRSEHRDQL